MSTFPIEPSPEEATSSTPVFDATRAESTPEEAMAALYSPATTDDQPADSGPSASDISSAAKDAGSHTASVAKDQAKEVVSEAKGQARQLLHETSSELREQAQTQQQRVAEGLRSLGAQFGNMAEGSDGVASELVTTLSQRSDSLAAWIGDRDPAALLSEVRSFAARRPGAFIAIAAGAGIVAGRLAKSLAASSSDASAES